jgi:type II secretory pathway pseudopilin PulG
MKTAPVQSPSAGHRRGSMRRGFTLVEVMVATGLLTMIGIALLSVLVGAYQVAAKARYIDHAQYVVKSYADEFLTQQATDTNGNLLPMFQITVDSNNKLTPLGTGLAWTNTDGTAGTTTGDSTGMYVLLGDNSGAPIQATVSRTIQYLDTSGRATQVIQAQEAGFLLEGVFTITFPYQGTTISRTVTAIRAVP